MCKGEKMSRYIDADLLMQKWLFRGKSQAMYRDEIRSVPTADVVEVVHGDWIPHEGYSQCDKCNSLLTIESNYCPNCGARMDGGK